MNPLIITALAGLVLGLIGWRVPRRHLPRLPASGWVALLFLVSRLVLLLMALLVQGSAEGIISPGALIRALDGPDAEHYLRIAEFGYQPGTEHENLIVFYPLYPLLIHAMHYIVPDYAVSGIVISNICGFGACLLLCRLVQIDHGARAGMRAVKYFLLYPFSFFLMAAYTEGLFLLLSLGCLYAARRRKYALCAMLGALCAFTRNQGVLLIVPAVCEFFDQEIRPMPGDIRNRLRNMPREGLFLPLIALGFILYLGLNYALYGNPLAFVEYQAAAPWFQNLEFFPRNLRQHWNMALEYPGLGNIIYLPQIALFFFPQAHAPLYPA